MTRTFKITMGRMVTSLMLIMVSAVCIGGGYGSSAAAQSSLGGDSVLHRPRDPAHALASLSESELMSKIEDVARAQGKPHFVIAVQNIFGVPLSETKIPGGKSMSYREEIAGAGLLEIDVNGDGQPSKNVFTIVWRSSKAAAQGCEGFPSLDHLDAAIERSGFVLRDKEVSGGEDAGAGPKGVTHRYLDSQTLQSAKREAIVAISFLRCSDSVFIGPPLISPVVTVR